MPRKKQTEEQAEEQPQKPAPKKQDAGVNEPRFSTKEGRMEKGTKSYSMADLDRKI